MSHQSNNPEDLIGQPISNIMLESLVLQLEHKTDEEILYSLNEMTFLSELCRSTFIKTDTQNIVSEILFSMDFKINQKLFGMLVEANGEPSKMFKIGTDDDVVRSEEVNDDYSATTVMGTAVDCTFSENPTFILWHKPNFTISIALPPNQDSSLIKYISNKL